MRDLWCGLENVMKKREYWIQCENIGFSVAGIVYIVHVQDPASDLNRGQVSGTGGVFGIHGTIHDLGKIRGTAESTSGGWVLWIECAPFGEMHPRVYVVKF